MYAYNIIQPFSTVVKPLDTEKGRRFRLAVIPCDFSLVDNYSIAYMLKKLTGRIDQVGRGTVEQ